MDYPAMNELAAEVPIGSDGVCVLPFGNGAERMLGNRNPGGSVHGLNFNRHTRAHLLRAAQEGIVFAFNYGLEVMKGMGISPAKIRAGHANMMLSPLFRQTLAGVSSAEIELYNTDGSAGAARGAGIGAGVYNSPAEAFGNLEVIENEVPDTAKSTEYQEAYARWKDELGKLV
jgi:xylulokinase